MAVILGTVWGKELADLLGLKHTRRITIETTYDDFVKVEVEALLDSEDSKRVLGWLQTKRYQLVEVEADEPVELMAGEHGLVETTAHGATFKTFVAPEKVAE